MVSYTEVVSVGIDNVWDHLLFKIDAPQYFVPGVSNVLILKKESHSTHRKMEISMPDGAIHTVEELITFDPYEVCFKLIEHPLYEGYVLNQAKAIGSSKTELTYTMAWFNKETKEPFLDSSLIEKAVKKSIEYILSNDSLE
jgi:hypothetical protein